MPKDDTQPILEVETNLPPMIHDQTPPTAGSAAPNDDLIMPAIVTTTTQKKKFAGGKIIATILGLFLLIGGVGAGTYLVQQNQDIREKATPGDPPPGCAITPPTNINVTNITANSATLNWTPGTGGDYVKLFVSSNSGGDPTGDCDRLSSRTTDSICVANEDTDYGLPATPSTYQVTGMSPSTTYYWRIMMWKESGCDYAAPTISFVTVLSATATPTAVPTAEPTAVPTVAPTATPIISAKCINIIAYSPTWTLLTNAELSTLTVGQQVNFCVTGSASDGTFDRARLTINGVLQAETSTIRPSSTDFCQLYTIPAGTTTFKVTAQIHHNILEWR